MDLESSPISKMDETDEMNEAMLSKRGCFSVLPCIGSSQPSPKGSVWWRRIRTVDKLESDEKWWVSKWKKIREWSELVAGPRWKTFIRRFRRNKHCCSRVVDGGCNRSDCNRPDHVSFRYDSSSYALNFDDGKQTGQFEDEFPYRDYSMRFAASSLPVSTKMNH